MKFPIRTRSIAQIFNPIINVKLINLIQMNCNLIYLCAYFSELNEHRNAISVIFLNEINKNIISIILDHVRKEKKQIIIRV